ncbi:MAG: hypothetical protein J0L89_09170 [Xanthomonadales bacterium]|nr:hypothetical protein [Xanthomonadaceae bacterium]MBN8224972.1 hypothetical protein [Xanthomonadales bacterium]MCA0199036.1 hypothetical protein [Pseudomonadota bacterium]HRF84072.1 hypothetical protein [Pseudoxanthomonas sp.]
MLLRGKFGPRRKALLVLLALALLAVAWMGWNGVAAVSGVETGDMDWDGDGTVTRSEILQSLYAVTATREHAGNRECTTFRWRRSGETIRMDCTTVFGEP